MGLRNGARVKVVDFMYKDLSGPQSGDLPEASDDRVAPFIPGIPNTTAMTTIQSEWVDNGKALICTHFLLMLRRAYTIHKPHGKNIDLVMIHIGQSEKLYGITLVYLSRVSKLSHYLTLPILLELFQMGNKSNILPTIKDEYADLSLDFDATRKCFSGFC